MHEPGPQDLQTPGRCVPLSMVLAGWGRVWCCKAFHSQGNPEGASKVTWLRHQSPKGAPYQSAVKSAHQASPSLTSADLQSLPREAGT